MIADSDNLSELPKGWAWTNLETLGHGKNAIVDGPFGSNLKKSDYIDDALNGVPVLTTKNLKGDYSDDKVRFISKQKFEELKRSQVSGGDILVAKIGSIGKTGIYPKSARTAIIPANLLKFTVTEGVFFQFVFNYLNFDGFQKLIRSIATATAQPAFNVTKFRKLPIPLPPLAEQKRIVAKIEELFTKLEAGVEALKNVKAQIKRYRQAVLKYAFEGKLTEQWRKKNKDKLEPASKLLERIAKEREKQAKGKRQKKLPLDTSELPQLPEGWEWITIGGITDMTSGKAFKKSEYASVGVRLFQIANVSFGKALWNNIAYLPKNYMKKYPNLLLKSGDVIMALNRPIFGNRLKVCVLEEADIPAILYQRVGRFDFYMNDMNKYFLYYVQSPAFVNMLRISLQGVDQPFINKPKLLNMRFPLCSLDEQCKTVDEIERHFSIADEIEQTIEKSLKQSDRLRQSILKRAFEGKLVPQDPEDEPAEKLLERIKAEKQNHSPEWKVKKRAGTSKLKALKTDKQGE